MSLLCTTSKIVEHIVFKNIPQFLKERNFFSHQLHGFRQGRSTTTQLADVTNYFFFITVHVDALFLDFDKVSDQILHQKI